MLKSLVIWLVVPAMLATGCARATETVREHPSTAIGAGAGAAGGALIGGLIADSPTGAVVGGLLGGLAGGAAGHYLGRQERGRSDAMQALDYTPQQGRMVRLEQAEAVPTAVKPGDTVNLAARYTVLTPRPGERVPVREMRVVRHGSEIVANPSAEFTRENGTYTSALPITLPANAEAGTYEVTTTVISGGESATETTRFEVR